MVVYDSTLITPTTGLMIWTLVTFVVVLIVLKKYAFGPIQQMIDARRAAITADLDAAETAREEAQASLAEYRQQLAEARKEASRIVEDARKVGEERRAADVAALEAETVRLKEQAKAEIAGRDPAGARRDQAARGRADDRGDREGRAGPARRGRAEAPDRRGPGRRRLRRPGAGGRRLVAERIEPAARVYADALYAAARDAGRTREVDADLQRPPRRTWAGTDRS